MLNTAKQCNSCKTIKDVSEYTKKTMGKDGYKRICKTCSCIAINKWRKSKGGIISNIFNHQKEASKRRGHKPPEYTQRELGQWLLAQSLFHRLYDKWVHSGYARNIIPSVDRKDDDIGYCMSNIQLMTFVENQRKPSRGTFKVGHGHRTSNRWVNH